MIIYCAEIDVIAHVEGVLYDGHNMKNYIQFGAPIVGVDTFSDYDWIVIGFL